MQTMRTGYAKNKKKIVLGASCAICVIGTIAIVVNQFDCKKEHGEKGALSEAACKNIASATTIIAEISGVFGALIGAYEVLEKISAHFRSSQKPDNNALDEKVRQLETLADQLMFEINKALIERNGEKAQTCTSEIVQMLEKYNKGSFTEMKTSDGSDKEFDPNTFINSLQKMRENKGDEPKPEPEDFKKNKGLSLTNNVKMIVMLSGLIKKPVKVDDFVQVTEVTESVIKAFKSNEKKRKVSAPARFGRPTMHEQAIIATSDARSLKVRKISAPLTKIELAQIEPLCQIMEDPTINPESDPLV